MEAGMSERDDSARRAGESAGLSVSGVETDTQTEGAEVEIRGTHPYSFRSGEWARIVAYDARVDDGRTTALVEFPDGITDTWVLDDPMAGWETRAAARGAEGGGDE